MLSNTILIVTNEELESKINITGYEIEIIKAKVDEKLIDMLNKSLYDTYKYIVFVDGCTNYKKLIHYIPLNLENNFQNKIFVNEIIINPIIINNIKSLNNNDRIIIELAVILKHLLKMNITIEKLNLNNEIEKISLFNNFEKANTEIFKKNVYRTIKQHYSQGNFFRKINFELNKNEIVKMFLFKTLENINEDIKKNTNRELVFKELVSSII